MHHAYIRQSQWHKIEEQAKTVFSAAPSLGCANFGPINALETIQLVPIRSPRTRSCQRNCIPLRSRQKHTVYWTSLYCTTTLHSVFLSFAKRSLLLWQKLVPDELMETSWLVLSAFIGPKLAQSRDGAAEKKVFLALPSMTMDKKTIIFCHCDRALHRILENDRRLGANKFCCCSVIRV